MEIGPEQAERCEKRHDLVEIRVWAAGPLWALLMLPCLMDDIPASYLSSRLSQFACSILFRWGAEGIVGYAVVCSFSLRARSGFWLSLFCKRSPPVKVRRSQSIVLRGDKPESREPQKLGDGKPIATDCLFVLMS